MYRVYSLIGFSSFLITLLCISLNSKFSLILFILGIISSLAVIFIKTNKKSILLIIILTVTFSSLNTYLFDLKIDEYNKTYCKDNVEISGTLVDNERVVKNGFIYTLETVDENRAKFTVLSKIRIDAEPGDIISGNFNFSNKYADYSQKIFFSAYSYGSNINVTKCEDKFNIVKLRNYFKQGIIENTSFGRGLTTAIVFGDKSYVSDKCYSDLQRCGLLHATATSGLHLTIFTGFVLTLLALFSVNKKKLSVIACAFVIIYMILIGFKYSLMRAGIMTLMVFAANLADRESDALNSLGISFAVLIALNPYTAVNCSFLLSAASMLGIIFIMKAANSKIDALSLKSGGFSKKIAAASFINIMQSASAVIFTLPVVYIFFGNFSAIGVLVNLFVSPLITVILILGFLICITSFIPVVPEIIGGVDDMVCLAIVKLCDFVSKFRYCLINIDYLFVGVTLFGISLICVICCIIYRIYNIKPKRLIKPAIIISVNIFALSFVLKKALIN